MALSTNILGGFVQLTGNPIRILVDGGSAPAGSSDYKLLLKIIDVNNSLLVAPEPDAIAPNSAGEAEFDISGKVDQPVNVTFQYPVVNPYVAYTTILFKIKVQPGESYVDSNGDPQEVWGDESDEFQLLKGGVSQRQIATWYATSKNFYSTYIDGVKFLTHRPWGDIVHPHQPVMLWLIPREDKDVTFTVRTVYDDDSETTYSTAVSLLATKIYQFNCNPYFLGTPLEPEGKKAKYFDVVLKNGVNDYSDNRRFAFDWKPCERPFYLVFQNSIGGVDDVYFSGRGEERFSIETTQVRKIPAYNASVKDPVIVTPHSSGQNKWTLNSGYKSITQMLHLRDLLVSRQKWLLYPNLNVTSYILIPVIITNSEVSLINHQENIHAIDINLEEAETSQYSFDNRLAT